MNVTPERECQQMSDSRLADLARSQHGLVTRAQARALISRHTLDDWVRARRLEPVRRGVYRVAGAPESWQQQLLATCLAAGPNAYASFHSAAALHELEGFGHDGYELTQFGQRPSVIEGVLIHESAVLAADHVTHVHSIPATSVARTLCDLTAIERPWIVARAVDEALRRKIVTRRSLARVAEALEGRGRHRCTVMREILEHRAPGYHPGDSNPEKRIAELLVRTGLPEPTRQHRVRIGSKRYRIDLCYPDHKIAIEYDSWGFHRGRQAFDDDRARGNDLVVLGFQLLRFTSRSGDQAIVDTVRAALPSSVREVTVE
jgi:very-short-patch-repair endonuclease